MNTNRAMAKPAIPFVFIRVQLVLLVRTRGRILAVPPKPSKQTPLPNPLPFERGEGEGFVRWYRQDAPRTRSTASQISRPKSGTRWNTSLPGFAGASWRYHQKRANGPLSPTLSPSEGEREKAACGGTVKMRPEEVLVAHTQLTRNDILASLAFAAERDSAD